MQIWSNVVSTSQHRILAKAAIRVPLKAALMTSESDSGLLESVYAFLMSNGHEATAKSLAKEAKLDDKKLKISKAFNLIGVFPPSLK